MVQKQGRITPGAKSLSRRMASSVQSDVSATVGSVDNSSTVTEGRQSALVQTQIVLYILIVKR